MKRLKIKRTVAICVLVFLITLAVISLTKEMVIQNWIEDAFEKHLNLKVKIQEVYFDVFSISLDLDGLHVLNPPNFGRHWLMNAPAVMMQFEVAPLLKRKLRIKQMTLDILEVNIVKDANGEVNLNTINRFGLENGKPYYLDIKRLDLSIRRVTYQDFTMSVPVKVYDLNLKHMQFENVKTLEDISGLIAAKIFERIGVSQIGVTKEDLAKHPESLNPILQAGTFLGDVIRTLKEVIPGDTSKAFSF